MTYFSEMSNPPSPFFLNYKRIRWISLEQEWWNNIKVEPQVLFFKCFFCACNLICIHGKALISRATEDLGKNQSLLILLSTEVVADPKPEATYLKCLSCVVCCTHGLTNKVVP